MRLLASIVATILTLHTTVVQADKVIVVPTALEDKIYYSLVINTLRHTRALFTMEDVRRIRVAQGSGMVIESSVVNFKNPVNEWLHLTYELYGISNELIFPEATLVTERDDGSIGIIELSTRDQWFHRERGVLRVRALQRQVPVGGKLQEYFGRNTEVLIFYTK